MLIKTLKKRAEMNSSVDKKYSIAEVLSDELWHLNTILSRSMVALSDVLSHHLANKYPRRYLLTRYHVVIYIVY